MISAPSNVVEVLSNVALSTLRKHPRFTVALVAISSVLTLIGVVFAIVAPAIGSVQGDTIRVAGSVAAGIALYAAFIGALALTGLTSFKFGAMGLQIELEPIRKQREEIESRIRGEAQPDPFSSLELNLNQLSLYYAINRAQARNGFRFGVFVIVVSLALLGLGIGLYYFNTQASVTVAAISGIGGVLGQFVGASGLFLYSKALTQSTYYYDQLARLQRLLLAAQLCDRIEDQDVRDATKSELAKTIGSSAFAASPAPV